MTQSKKYKEFIFHNFEINKKKNKIKFHYSFDNEIFFDPEISINLTSVKNISEIKSAVFNLGMAELPSFYKAFCPKKITIKAGYLDKGQILFWKKLYENGLGEFFYNNKIDFRKLINIKVDSKAPKFKNTSIKIKGEKVLLPIGGGKDSIVSAETLKEKNIDFTWFAIEPNIAIKNTIKVSKNNKKIFVKRNIQKNFKKIIELNKKGAYNGHIPISSVYAFSSVLVAQIHNFKYIALSNERSANIGNTKYLGKEINHQYSKSLEFEKLINKYIRKNISPDIYYFSLLRNLYEIQIIKKFSKYPQYFPVFLSCNPGLKENKWCGKCAKCAFAFAGLSAYLSPEIVRKIFNKNLFEDKKLTILFKELAGLENFKPFDCVGTTEETHFALYLAKQKYEKLPHVLKNIDFKNRKIFNLEKKPIEHIIPKKFLIEKIAIAGFGLEGKALYEYFIKQPNTEIHIFDENKLPKISKAKVHKGFKIPKEFSVVYKSPGIPTNKLKLENKDTKISSLTNVFLEKTKGLVIGVTGTKGKSTVTSLIHHILKNNGVKSHLIGNIGVTGLKYLDNKNNKKKNVYLYEMSSFQCEHLTKSPDIAILTNIFPDHLNHHKNFKEYSKAKLNIMRFQEPSSLFINAQKIKLGKNKFDTKLIGRHNQINCLIAHKVSRELNIPEEKIKSAIKTFKPLPYRLEKVAQKKGIIFYDDPLATIPEATLASIKALKNVNTIILGGLNRNIPLDNFARQLKNTNIKNFITFPETGKKMTKYIKDRKVIEVNNMKDAVQAVYKNCNGVCLMSSAASSFNLFKNYKDKSEQYRYWIKELG